MLVLNMESTSIDSQHLLFCKRLLDDVKRLCDYNIRDKSVLMRLGTFCGGTHKDRRW